MKSLKTLFVGTAILGATVLTGCFLNDSGSSSKKGGEASLLLAVGVKDVNNMAKQGLGKSSAIELSKLVVTLTSNSVNDSVIRDTLFADSGDIDADAMSPQQIIKSYSIKALRNWTIQVKTLDVNDSVVHIATSTQNSFEIGEVRQIILNLTSKYVVYVAKFTLPDSLGSQDTSVHNRQKLYVNRFVMVVDGDTVRDTTSSPGFFAATPSFHLVEWNYVRADTTHSVELYVFADSLGSWDPTRPIFGDTIQITTTDTTYTPELPYTGPGSPSDPACQLNPANCGGATAGLEINLGAVGLVNINPVIPSQPLPKRKD